jgi:Domain of unknown function (DUF4403)
MKLRSFYLVLFMLARAITIFAQNLPTNTLPTPPTKPMESYTNTPDEARISTLNIPVNIELWELEHAMNNKIAGVIYEDRSFTDDNLMVVASKSNWITMRLDANSIYYRVPIHVWMLKNIKLANVEGEGELYLNFKTNFRINESWDLTTYTEVVDFQWIRKPVVKLGFADLPVEYVANIVLNKSKASLAQAIDKQVKESMNIKQSVQDAWNLMQQPIQLMEAYKMWVKVTPQALSMTPLRAANNVIQTIISAKGISEVTFGDKPFFHENTQLPPLVMNENASTDDYFVTVNTDIPYEEAERMAKLNILGQTFTGGGKTVKVEDIKLFGQGEKMMIETLLSGDFEGNVFFIGKPVFKPETNTVEMEDLDYELKTKNFLYKSLNAIFHSKLKSTMAENMKFPMSDKLDLMKNIIQQQLANYQVNENMSLKGELHDISVDKTYLTPQGIKVLLTSKGKLNMFVKGLSKKM